MTPEGQVAAAARVATSLSNTGTWTTRQPSSKKGKAALAACEEEAPKIEASTGRIGTRSQTRVVPPIPTNAQVLHKPRASSPSYPSAARPSGSSSPHRPSPQILVNDLADASFVSSVSPTTTKPRKKGKARDSAKQQKFESFRDMAENEAQLNTLDGLARLLGDVIATMKAYSGAPTKACYDALDAITNRLVEHQTFPQVGDEREALGAVVSRTVSAPVKELVTKVEAQHKAIISLTKTVESLKKVPQQLINPSSPRSSPSPSSSYARAAYSAVSPKVAQAPPRDPSDERILVRFDGVVPPLLKLLYPQILSELNAKLASRSLPVLRYTQKYSGSNAIFIIPKTKEDLALILARWDKWAPSVLPGGRIVPPATYCFLQVDGVSFSSVDSLDDITRQFEECNPELGKVVGTATWVNKPPSEGKVAIVVSRGRKPPKAGSLFIRLRSKELVDLAVSKGRIILGGTAPAVGRGFPHLRICQCWGCFKFRHTRSRCTASPLCGVCGKDAHGTSCTEKPTCINCGEAHRSDSLACPTRKRIAVGLQQQAADICRALDETSKYRRALPSNELLSPLPAALGLGLSLSDFTNTPAPRLPERS